MSRVTAKQAVKKAASKAIDGLVALAVSKFKLPKEARDSVAPGKYQIDELVRVVGSVTVGKEFEKANVASLPQMKVICMLASQISTDRLAKMMSPENLAKVSDKDVAEFSKRIQGVWAKLAKSVTQTYKGPVTSKLVFEKK